MHSNDVDFAAILVASVVAFVFCAAFLLVRYRKSIVLCTFLLVPLMLFFVMQQHARLSGLMLTGFGLAAAAVCLFLDQYLKASRRSTSSAKIGFLADFLWDVLPALVVPPILVAWLHQPFSAGIIVPLAILVGCAVYLANFGRKRARRMRSRQRSRKGNFRIGLRGFILGGPLGVALFSSGLLGGSLVYFSGVSLFYGGLIQMPTTQQDVWSTRQRRTERRTRHGFVAVTFGLALMLVGVANCLAVQVQ